MPSSDPTAKVKALEARDVAGYKAQPQTRDEIEIWLSEQVWDEYAAGCVVHFKDEPKNTDDL